MMAMWVLLYGCTTWTLTKRIEKKKVWWELLRDVMGCFQSFLEVLSNKTAVARPFTSYLTNHGRNMSNSYWVLLLVDKHCFDHVLEFIRERPSKDVLFQKLTFISSARTLGAVYSSTTQNSGTRADTGTQVIDCRCVASFHFHIIIKYITCNVKIKGIKSFFIV